jgi:hypothetical protein
MLAIAPRPALLRALAAINLALYAGAVHALVAFNARPTLGWGLAGVTGLVAGLLLSGRLASRYQTLHVQAQALEVAPWPTGRPRQRFALSQLQHWHEITANAGGQRPYREIRLVVKAKSQSKLLKISNLEYRNYDQLRTWLLQKRVPRQ